MIPVGYMAKRVSRKPQRLVAPQVTDIYSVSSCLSENFADYVKYWKHNGYWLFDSAGAIRAVAKENTIELEGMTLFYYEAYEMEFDGASWSSYTAEPSFPTNVEPPSTKQLEGFDVVTFCARNRPECSPLSCNSLAKDVRTNEHCLFHSFDQAATNLKNGAFSKCEPGPYRIFSVHSVGWL